MPAKNFSVKCHLKWTFYGTYAITESDIISFENTTKVWLHRRLKWFTLFEFQWTLSCLRSPLNVVDDTEQMTVDQILKQIIKISPLCSHIFMQCNFCNGALSYVVYNLFASKNRLTIQRTFRNQELVTFVIFYVTFWEKNWHHIQKMCTIDKIYFQLVDPFVGIES